MTLEPYDFDDFSRIHKSLLRFVAAQEGNNISSEEIEHIGADQTKELCDTFADNPKLFVDRYLKENPDQLPKEDLAVVAEWKTIVTGRFVLFRQLKKHAILLGPDNKQTAYGVVGLTQPLADVTSGVPSLIDITLLPFRGILVYDGMIAKVPIFFQGGIKQEFNEWYKSVKAGNGIITHLGKPPKKKAKPTPADRVSRLAESLTKKLDKNREASRKLKEFEDNILPVFKAWLDEVFGKKRAELSALRSEVEDLEILCDEVEFARDSGEPFQVDDVGKFIQDALDIDELNESSEDQGDEDEAGPDFSEMPDFILESMFEEMMASVRGIDVNKMAKAEYQEAWNQFKETIKHAQSGDKNAFEKAMYKVGADKSDDNVSAVKKAFRRLARKLHPDRNPDFGEEAQELWNELKASKEALDLNSIEQIDVRWRIIKREKFSAKEEKKLKALQVQLEDEWYEIKGSLNYYSDHPMWNTEVGDKPSKQVKRQIAKDIDDEIRELNDEKIQLRKEIERLTKKRKAKPKSKKKTTTKKSKAKKKSARKAVKKKVAKKKATEEPETPDAEQMTFDF